MAEDKSSPTAQEGDALIILDQHGAHERILYERLRKNPEAPPATLERPVTVVVPDDLAPEVWALEEGLGGGPRLLRLPLRAVRPGCREAHRGARDRRRPQGGVPGGAARARGRRGPRQGPGLQGLDKVWGNLSREGMAALLHEWAACQFPNVCPHGRSIVKRVALADLLRGFGRL